MCVMTGGQNRHFLSWSMNVGVPGVLGHTLLVIRKLHGFIRCYGSKIQESEWWMSPNVLKVSAHSPVFAIFVPLPLIFWFEFLFPVKKVPPHCQRLKCKTAWLDQPDGLDWSFLEVTIAQWFVVAEMSGNQKDVFDSWTWFPHATGRDNHFYNIPQHCNERLSS